MALIYFLSISFAAVYCFKLIFSLPEALNATFPKVSNATRPKPFNATRPKPFNATPQCIEEWHYVDEDEWCCNHSAICCGEYQSPINIDIDRTTYDRFADCLLLQNYACIPEALIFVIVQLLYKQSNKSQEAYTLKNGIKYIFDRAVFHFGENSSTGSEHTLNNHKFPLEMQLVHRNEKYKTIEEAKTKSDGLLIISVLFVTADEDNDDLRGLIYDMHYVIFKDDYYCVKPFPISMLLPRPYGLYYNYKGSMTVPPCYESVDWVVFHNPVPISEFQLNQFRKLQHHTNLSCPTAECPMWNNYRRLTCERDRKVKWKEECNPITCPSGPGPFDLAKYPDLECCYLQSTKNVSNSSDYEDDD